MMKLRRRPDPAADKEFAITVALQERWVRDALLAFAKLIAGKQVDHTVEFNRLYNSASRAVRGYITAELDEIRLEQLLVATLFLGMIEINNPRNQIFPLLHFEAVGRFLDALHAVQQGKILSDSVTYFHRIALESYLYHVSIQSLFYPRTDRYTALTSLLDEESTRRDVNADFNVLIKLDIKVYVALFHLSRLARPKDLSDDQRTVARQLDERLRFIEATALAKLEVASAVETHGRISFWKMTSLATAALLILSAKVLDRSLVATSARIQALFHVALVRLEDARPAREWTGDFCWIFAILFCAVDIDDDSQRLARKLQDLSHGIWGSDLERMRRALDMVRKQRKARAENQADDIRQLEADDTLNLLVEGRLSLE